MQNPHKNLKGTLTKNAPLGAQSWFRCGGNADLLFQPADQADLAAFLKTHPYGEPLTIIGGLANTIIRDGGIRGATIQLGKAFSDISLIPSSCGSRCPWAMTAGSHAEPQGDAVFVKAGAGALNGSIAAFAVKNGIGGFEFLSGIPGTLGGALRMNAGAYGADIADILIEIHALDCAGNKFVLRPRPMDTANIPSDAEALEINLSYRNNDAPHYLIFTGAILRGKVEDYATVKSRITDIKAKRNETQPIKEQTGGSTFANPNAAALRRVNLPQNTRAWQVVDMVGGRGLTIGGAKMSEKHCNFMINTGNATATDLEMLGDELITRARHDLGLDLHWEIKRVGEKV
ncbi:MAG: UDP-N-acetylmuramate dehydrogenase [Alphaproteobacteria bacterium]